MKPVIVSGLRLPPGHSEAELQAQIARKSNMSVSDLSAAGYRIVHKSIDARRRGNVSIVYAAEISPPDDRLRGLEPVIRTAARGRNHRSPVIVGSGPAGLFAALLLARSGCEPVLLEQGADVALRARQVKEFWDGGKLDPDSNVQFGEGGAGTFSDGKLTTNISNPLCRVILEEMVLAGAPEEILLQGKPHIGTDRLRGMVREIRRQIIAAGGTVLFNSKMTGFLHRNGQLQQVMVRQKGEDCKYRELELAADHLILAAGHSSREIFSILHQGGVDLQAKPFSLGLRLEHRQIDIDRIQYKEYAGHPDLPPAEYKLACHLPDGRSVYTFCMCPGGQVIAAASEQEGLVVNGMSYFARSGRNANSALLVGVTPDDFPDRSPLGGMCWQKELEIAAYDLGGDFRAPCQTLADFCGLRLPDGCTVVEPSYQPGVSWCDLARCLPAFVTRALRDALPELERKMRGFADPGAVFTGVESRSSSPVRVGRGSDLQSSIRGIYPCGEGAGYAGGIMSAAVDGLKCARAVLANLE